MLALPEAGWVAKAFRGVANSPRATWFWACLLPHRASCSVAKRVLMDREIGEWEKLMNHIIISVGGLPRP